MDQRGRWSWIGGYGLIHSHGLIPIPQVVGSQARILYSDHNGRIGIAMAFNKAIADGRLKVHVQYM